MKTILVLFVSLFSINAFSHSPAACLSQASNDQLIGELEARLTSGGPGGSFAFATFSCFGSSLNVSLVNQDGDEDTVTQSTTTGTNCELYASQMTKKAGSTISTGVIVVSCFGSTMNRLLLNATGEIKELSSQSFTTGTRCAEKAKEINEI